MRVALMAEIAASTTVRLVVLAAAGDGAVGGVQNQPADAGFHAENLGRGCATRAADGSP